MTLETLDKITTASKHLCFNKTAGHKHQKLMPVPYEQLIVTNATYPDKVFLVHKCVTYKDGKLEDSSYHVYSFDMDGGNKKEEQKGAVFFRDMKVLKKIT